MVREIGWGVWLVCLACWCRADIPPDVVLRAKQATALVEVEAANGSAEGSAFCIDGTGLFVTNAHVVEPLEVGGKLKLVLRSGEKDQKIVSTHVIALDKVADLAILQTDASLKLPFLPLGSSDNLLETMSIVAFGYPFGSELAVKEGDYPNISVSTGHITALRKLKGELHVIQLDASLNPGNSGGPVVNEKGEVIGIVREGIPGSGINDAIPVTALRALFARAQILFHPPTFLTSRLRESQEFRIQLLTPPTGSAEVMVDLSLSADTKDHRSYHAVSKDGRTFVVQTSLLPPLKDQVNQFDAIRVTPAPLPASVEYHITAKQDGKILGELTGTISLRNSAVVPPNVPKDRANQAAPNPPDLGPYTLDPTNGHWYGAISVRQGLSWMEAEVAAKEIRYRGRHGHLVTLTSASESDFVVRKFPQVIDGRYWMGAYKDPKDPNYRDPAAGWHWVTGEPWQYTNWNGPEPNGDVGAPHSDFIQFTFGGRWNDVQNRSPNQNDVGKGFIIEFEP